MALFFIAGMVMMIIKRIPNGIFIAGFFLFLSYLFASWLTWFFGGSMGMRPFVEYYSILALPFGYSLDWVVKRRNLLVQSLFLFIIVAFSWYNLRLAYHYNCFPGSVWSWDDYRIYLSDAGIQHSGRTTYTYINDFENNTFPDDIPRISRPVHSRTLSSFMNETMEFGVNYSRRFDQIISVKLSEATACLYVKTDQAIPAGALLVCSIEDTAGKLLYYKTVTFEGGITEGKKGVREGGEGWKKVSGVFHFPEWIPSASTISFYVWNVRRSKFYVDDLVIKFI
jgi:hypothetical protein